MSKNLKRGDRVTIIGGHRLGSKLFHTGIVTADYEEGPGLGIRVALNGIERIIFFYRDELRIEGLIR